MGNIWGRELSRVLVALALVLLAGAMLGAPLPAFVLFLAVYLLSQLLHLNRLYRWLRGGGEYPPSGSPVWEEVYYLVHLLRRRNKRRKKRLIRIVDRFRSAFAALPDGTVVLNAQNRIEWFNDAASRLLGLKSVDVDMQVANLVRHPHFVEFMHNANGQHTVTIPSPVLANVMLEIRRVPYGDDMHLLVAQDVTQLRFMERVRSDFVANVSHELRTPLTVMKGYLETLTDSGDPALAAHGRVLRRLSEQTERMRRLVDDLLCLTRIESSLLPAVSRRVNVAAMLRGIGEDAAVTGSEHAAIELQIESGADVLGDEQDLRSAFSNLVVNAVRHTPAKGRIAVRWRDEENGGVRLDVEDTGEGILEEHIPRLTERFYRVEYGARGKSGTGLGLAIVKHVLARHDAELKIVSRVGQGSCFSCLFPAGRVVRDRNAETD
jgi:two-component system phosphate regulon sensor histidine kinase PhoR